MQYMQNGYGGKVIFNFVIICSKLSIVYFVSSTLLCTRTYTQLGSFFVCKDYSCFRPFYGQNSRHATSSKNLLAWKGMDRRYESTMEKNLSLNFTWTFFLLSNRNRKSKRFTLVLQTFFIWICQIRSMQDLILYPWKNT